MKPLFCSGLMDEGESAEVAALRELKEETGYKGEVVGVTPGISSSCLCQMCSIQYCFPTIEADSIFSVWVQQWPVWTPACPTVPPTLLRSTSTETNWRTSTHHSSSVSWFFSLCHSEVLWSHLYFYAMHSSRSAFGSSVIPDLGRSPGNSILALCLWFPWRLKCVIASCPSCKHWWNKNQCHMNCKNCRHWSWKKYCHHWHALVPWLSYRWRRWVPFKVIVPEFLI